MSSNRYLFPDHKIVSKKRTQKKVLGWLFIAIIIAVIGFGILTYLSTTETLLSTKNYHNSPDRDDFANKNERVVGRYSIDSSALIEDRKI